MSLKDELTEIRGVGDATAETILEVVDENTEETTDVDVETLEEAYRYLKQNKTREARRRMEDALDL